MKKLFIAISLTQLFSLTAMADALLTCQDGAGQEIFRGYIAGDHENSEKISREQDVHYSFAVAVKPLTGMDRATFTRKTGIDLKECEGPYATVYEKLEKGRFRCAGGKIKALEEGERETDASILEAMGINKAEIPCSAILTKEKLRGGR